MVEAPSKHMQPTVDAKTRLSVDKHNTGTRPKSFSSFFQQLERKCFPTKQTSTNHRQHQQHEQQQQLLQQKQEQKNESPTNNLMDVGMASIQLPRNQSPMMTPDLTRDHAAIKSQEHLLCDKNNKMKTECISSIKSLFLHGHNNPAVPIAPGSKQSSKNVENTTVCQSAFDIKSGKTTKYHPQYNNEGNASDKTVCKDSLSTCHTKG